MKAVSSDNSDGALILRARNGDNAAVGLLWTRYETRIAACCRSFLRDASLDPAVDAQDLAGEVFLRALHRLELYADKTAEGAGFEHWLLEIARHLCLNHLARQRRRRQWTLPNAPLDWEERLAAPCLALHTVEEREFLHLVMQEINLLPLLYRIPFKMLLEERSYKEIAVALGIGTESAAKRIQRARKLLQSRLDTLQAPSSAAQDAASHDLYAAEQALTDILCDYRVVEIRLPSGGEIQICLRVEQSQNNRDKDALLPKSLARNAWKQRLKRAETYYAGGQWESAREDYRAALAIRPDCLAAALKLGEMLLQEKKTVNAQQVYRQALAHHTTPAAQHTLQAFLLAAEQRDLDALAAFEAAIVCRPKEKTLYYGLFQAQGRLSRYEAQISTLHRLLRFAPDDLFALVEIYTPYARLRRFADARPLLERAVLIAPQYPPALKHLFQVRMNLGLRDTQTLRLAEQAVRIAPDYLDGWNELSWFYEELGRHDIGIAILKRFLKDHPNNPQAHATLAWRYHYRQNFAEEILHAEQAYKLDPRSWYISWTLLTACKAPPIPFARGQKYAAEIAARFASDAFLNQTLAMYYLHHKHLETALHHARHAVMLCATPEAETILANVEKARRLSSACISNPSS